METEIQETKQQALISTMDLPCVRSDVTHIPESIRGNNVFMGIGLSAGGKVSDGLPIDTLSMIAVAKTTADTLKGVVRILIADTHANGVLDTEQHELIKSRSIEFARLLSITCKVLRLDNVTIELASDANWHNPSLSTSNNHYVEREISDLQHVITNLNCGAVIGWVGPLINGNLFEGQDERWFHLKASESGVDFTNTALIYTGNGLSLDLRNGKDGFMVRPPYFADPISPSKKIIANALAERTNIISNAINGLEGSVRWKCKQDGIGTDQTEALVNATLQNARNKALRTNGWSTRSDTSISPQIMIGTRVDDIQSLVDDMIRASVNQESVKSQASIKLLGRTFRSHIKTIADTLKKSLDFPKDTNSLEVLETILNQIAIENSKLLNIKP